MRFVRPTIVGVVVSLIASLMTGPPVSAGAAATTPAQSARAWLAAQQQADGDFELAAFPGFETPDAILALATDGQTTGTWSQVEARAAVEAVDTNGDGTGLTALDWVDDYVDGGVSAGIEAKVALLVARPLGYDASAFDPQGDGATDLTDSLDTISPGLFNSFLFARTVEAELGGSVHQNDLQSICEAQHTDGGWSFDAVPDGTNGADLDTSGFATMALSAAGVPDTDPVVSAASGYFEATQLTSGPDAGAWLSFGSADPNATTLAVLGHLAAGGTVGGLSADASAWLASQQVTTLGPPPDDVHTGRIRSPNDGFGINTFATSQSILGLHALAGDASWLPVETSASGRQCLGAHPFTDVAPSAWNDNALRWLDRFSIAAGYPDGTFRQGNVFNRAQASMWFNRFFPEVTGAPNTFTDVPDGAWYGAGADFVGDAEWPGGAIAAGFPPNNQFRATDPFNRGQAVLWMYKAAGRPSVAGLDPHGFSDGAPWFDDAVTWAKANGIVSGYPDNTFRPLNQINRGQGASWFYNLAASPAAWDCAITPPSTVVYTLSPC